MARHVEHARASRRAFDAAGRRQHPGPCPGPGWPAAVDDQRGGCAAHGRRAHGSQNRQGQRAEGIRVPLETLPRGPATAARCAHPAGAAAEHHFVQGIQGARVRRRGRRHGVCARLRSVENLLAAAARDRYRAAERVGGVFGRADDGDARDDVDPLSRRPRRTAGRSDPAAARRGRHPGGSCSGRSSRARGRCRRWCARSAARVRRRQPMRIRRGRDRAPGRMPRSAATPRHAAAIRTSTPSPAAARSTR